LGLAGLVSFHNPVPNKKTPAVYRKHDLFVNLTVTGSFDKSTLEAMTCELPILVSNLAFRDILGPQLSSQLMFEEGDHRELAEKILAFSNLSPEKKKEIGKKLRPIVTRHHDLESLINRLAGSLRQILIK
jgi:glycosyltransferase involved in cell wall biosynthesis